MPRRVDMYVGAKCRSRAVRHLRRRAACPKGALLHVRGTHTSLGCAARAARAARTVAPQVLGRIALSLFMSPRPPPSRATQRSVALLSLVFVVSVGSGNAALRYIHISFAQSIGATAPL